MKIDLRISVLFLLLIGFLSACTVQKRLYRKGYTVDWSTRKTVNEKEVLLSKIEEKQFVNTTSETKFSDQAKEHPFVEAPSENKVLLSVLSVDVKTDLKKTKKERIPDLIHCDTVRKTNGEILEVNIVSENAKEIIYKLCGKENSSKFFMSKNEIQTILYHDGRVTEINEPELKGNEKQGNKNSSGSGDRSQILALVLAVLVGGFGVHRFYLGYYALGVLYFITGGFCLIGVLVDIILILTGDLQPKNGSYYDEIF